ncbi:hypothetical protein VNO77_02761 [Canavalia gladiata]|uniref:Uncharacterized protein n=1 Tax=Canavalia gladiata TaxID=3824 RepID=A0AAN9R675_CANGL
MTTGVPGAQCVASLHWSGETRPYALNATLNRASSNPQVWVPGREPSPNGQQRMLDQEFWVTTTDDKMVRNYNTPFIKPQFNHIRPSTSIACMKQRHP